VGSVGGKQVYLSLGSNLGDRLGFLAGAVSRLAGFLRELRVSSVYETAPMYVTDQPRFLNVVVAGRTRLGPRRLLARCLAIERELGRDRAASGPKGPRPIDIDLLLYADRLIHRQGLRVPHPGLRERRFVLEPLLELEPGVLDPATGRRLGEALAGLPEQGVDRVGPWDYTLCLPEHEHGHPGREAEL
jgi:2-amino-4-hydroxy-6-hydroxymethyldihydropteridine diphosphokinase